MDEQEHIDTAVSPEDSLPADHEEVTEAIAEQPRKTTDTGEDLNEPVENRGPESSPPETATVVDGGASPVDERLDRMVIDIATLLERVSYLPGQIRNLGGRVDAMAASISETRFQTLLKDLLGLYDLVEQMRRSARTGYEAGQDRPDELAIIQTQIIQLLEYNGLTRIPAKGRFDPELHRAVDRVPCSEAEQADMIVKKVRDGFRTEHQVLRYAEVVVSHYAPPEKTGSAPRPEQRTEKQQEHDHPQAKGVKQ